MKILIIADLFPNKTQPYRGVFVYNLAIEMIKQGNEVRVISPVPWAHILVKNRSQRWRELSALPAKTVWKGVPVYYTRYLTSPRDMGFRYYGWSFYLGMKETIKDIVNDGFDLDIIHAHVALPDGFAGMLLGKKYKKPMVVTIHGQDVLSSIYRSRAIKKAIIRVLDSSQCVITVSNMLKQEILNIFPMEDKIKVVYNGIPRQYISTGQQTKLYAKDEIEFLSVGALIPRKGHDITIRAFSKIHHVFPSAHLTIIGEGKERNNLEQLVRQLNLKDCVFLEGGKEPEQVREYMKDCDIFVLPSWRECFGVVYLEAMANGKPIIGCSGEGVQDIIKNGENGFLVPPKDIEALARVMLDLAADENKRSLVGSAGKKVVEENFLWEHKASETIDLYKKVIAVYKNKVR